MFGKTKSGIIIIKKDLNLAVMPHCILVDTFTPDIVLLYDHVVNIISVKESKWGTGNRTCSF